VGEGIRVGVFTGVGEANNPEMTGIFRLKRRIPTTSVIQQRRIITAAMMSPIHSPLREERGGGGGG
jgi:hypothetical protein